MASKASGSREPERTCGVTSSSFQNSQKGNSSVSDTEPKNKSVRGGYTCCVPGCYSNTKRDQELSFHKFPKDESMEQRWNERTSFLLSFIGYVPCIFKGASGWAPQMFLSYFPCSHNQTSGRLQLSARYFQTRLKERGVLHQQLQH